MDSKQSDRRRFLQQGAALAGLAAAAQQVAGAQSAASEGADHVHGEAARYAAITPAGRGMTKSITHTTYYTPLQDSVGIITPAPLHFMQAHSRVPDTDAKQYRLVIHGMVDRPLSFSLDELKRLPSMSRIHFLECLANSSPRRHESKGKGAPPVTVQYTHGITSCSEWTGVSLAALLKEVGVQKDASWLVAEGGDSSHYTYAIPLSKALDDVMLVYGQNGEPVRPEQGYPLRLFVPGWGANHSVKWLRQIKIVDRPYMTWDQSVHHTVPRADLEGKSRWYNFMLPPKSVITRPSAGQTLPARGYYEITGLAWSGGGAIRKVEVSTDGGKSWKEARIQGPALRMAHTRFTMDWAWDGEETLLQSRCTDDQGEVQPTLAQMNKNWGRAENDRITPESDSFHWNAIQPWKIAKDGSITDALFA